MLVNELNSLPYSFFAPSCRKRLYFEKGRSTVGSRAAPFKPRLEPADFLAAYR